MWGSFVANGLLTAITCPLARIEAPSATVFTTLRADPWEQITGVVPPSPLPPANDPFWQSEYFDLCLDTWNEGAVEGSSGHWASGDVPPPCSLQPNEPACGDWDRGIAKSRYQGRTLIAYADGHAASVAFPSTYRSKADNQWDLR